VLGAGASTSGKKSSYLPLQLRENHSAALTVTHAILKFKMIALSRGKKDNFQESRR